MMFVPTTTPTLVPSVAPVHVPSAFEIWAIKNPGPAAPTSATVRVYTLGSYEGRHRRTAVSPQPAAGG